MQRGGIYLPGMEMFFMPILEKTGLSPVGAVSVTVKNWARGEIKTNVGNHTSSYIIMLMEFMLRDKLIPLLTSPGDAGDAGDAGAHPTLSEAAVKIAHFYEKVMILELIKGITGFEEQKRIFLGALRSSPIPPNAENDFPTETESATTKEKLYEVERDYVRTLSKVTADTTPQDTTPQDTTSALHIAYNNLLNDMINSYLTPFGNRGLPHLINGMMFGENVLAVVEQSLDVVYKAYTPKGVGEAYGQRTAATNLGMRMSKAKADALEQARGELFRKIENYLGGQGEIDQMEWKDVGSALQLGDIIRKAGGEYHDGEWTEEASKQLLAYIEEVDKTIKKNTDQHKSINRSDAVSEVLLAGGDHVASSEYVQHVDGLLRERAAEDRRRSTASEDSRRSSGSSWGSSSSVSVLDAPAAPAAAAAPPATVCGRCETLADAGFQGEAAVCGLCKLAARQHTPPASGGSSTSILDQMEKAKSLSAGVHWRTEGEQSDRAQVAGLPIGHQPPRAMTPPASGGSTTPRSAEGGTESDRLDTAVGPIGLTAGGMRYRQTKSKNKKLKTKKSKNKKPKTRKSKKLRFKKLRSKKQTTKKRQSKNKRY